jgi:hypothetical protein
MGQVFREVPTKVKHSKFGSASQMADSELRTLNVTTVAIFGTDPHYKKQITILQLSNEALLTLNSLYRYIIRPLLV